MHQLQIDEKWTVSYLPEENDRPLYLYRYGEYHSVFPSENAVVAMFYKLKELQDAHP
jgi:hypothetical protein